MLSSGLGAPGSLGAPVDGRVLALGEPHATLVVDRSTAVLPDAISEALGRLRDAEADYERARARDWRRSLVAPSLILPPLLEAVQRARLECQRLGLPVEARG